MPLGNELCERYWRMAEASEIGVKIPVATVDDMKIVHNELGLWRRKHGGFENFSLVLPEKIGDSYELFILRKPVEVE